MEKPTFWQPMLARLNDLEFHNTPRFAREILTTFDTKAK
jgi:hypothetical protein